MKNLLEVESYQGKENIFSAYAAILH